MKRFVVGIVVLLALAGCADYRLIPEPERSLGPAKHFRKFPLFYLGFRYRDLPLTGNGSEDVLGYKRGSVVFLYGQCRVDLNSDDARCGAPLQIQNFPACRKFPPRSGARSGPRAGVGTIRETPQRLRIRGVPVVYYTRLESVEIYTRDTVVVVQGVSPREARRLALRLQGVNTPISQKRNLPRPLKARLTGRAKRCPVER